MKIFNFGELGRALLMTAVLVVGAVCVSYGDNPSELAGRWIYYEGASGSLLPEEIELFSDGTGIIKRTYGNAYETKYENSSITWKAENNRLRLLSPTIQAIVADYNVSGYELILIYDESQRARFIKKENFEEYKKKREEKEKKEAEQRAEEKKKEQERIKKEEEQRIEKVSSYFTDSRNGQKYRSVKIGGKTWMAQNLNYQTGNSWCYDYDNSNCEKYGRLYDWKTAKTACPKGWHLPSDKEWDNLVAAVGGKKVAGKVLKSTIGWGGNGNGIDNNGFSALPGGFRLTNGSFRNAGSNGYWWTGTENYSGVAYYRDMSFYDNVNEYYGDEGRGYSVRCVQE